MIKLSRNTLLLFKIIVALAAYGFVFVKLYGQLNEGFIKAFINVDALSNWYYLVFVILLMPVSWAFEAIKWQLAFYNESRPTFFYALKTIWYGVAVGLFTPNRTGEPIGRMAMVSQEVRAKAGFLAVLCGMTQQLATLFFGFVGVAFFIGISNDGLSRVIYNPWIIILLVLVTIVVLLLVFKFGVVSKIISKSKILKPILNGESIVFSFSYIRIVVLVFLSFIRYAVFSTQLVILIFYFGFNGSIFFAYAAVFATYLFASVIPTFAISEAGVRAGFAILFIGTIWNNPVGIASATLLLWLLNVALPGLIAVWFPVFKGDKNEKQGENNF